MDTTKKLMTLLLAIVLPVTIFALPPTNYDNYEFEVDGIYYKIESDVACVTYQRYESGMHLSDYHGDVVIPSSVTYQGKTYPVKTIDFSAFNYCQGLRSITIPESITTIRDNAFWLCTGLTRVNITDIDAWCKIMMGNANPLIYAHHLYLNGTEVTDVTIPDGITAISNYAFDCCEGLISLTIPSSVISIGNNAFENCFGLKIITCKAMTPPTVPAAQQLRAVTSAPYKYEGCTYPLRETPSPKSSSVTPHARTSRRRMPTSGLSFWLSAQLISR